MKRNDTRAVGALLEHLRAENVGGQQVRRELHALLGEAEHAAERLDELGLGEAGHADEQPVAAGEDGDERLLDDLVLAEDDGADRGAGAADMVEGAFGGCRTTAVSSEVVLVSNEVICSVLR